ncbi:Phosphate-starvation-inducible E family protein [Giardia muris]|uniref:Phosphate-starvation-inducible E family protein n=1 Tax=Giardia muris TaxID=5742 RepID=A0A4Z1SM34_GIAMU|nr:Phosphate-starvation-inducible E family protein [Giardia muris]|eukprot:TNJ26736.1 Phosphate-starvation-inducible E family protein [Giardia muris]
MNPRQTMVLPQLQNLPDTPARQSVAWSGQQANYRRSLIIDRGHLIAAGMPDVKPSIAQESAEIADRKKTCSNQFLKQFIVVMLIFEKYVMVILAVILAIFIGAALIGSGYQLYNSFASAPHLIFGTTQYSSLFSAFFYVLIGLELLQSVVVHTDTSDAHVEVIVLVAITAIARKIIILDADHATIEKMGGIALIMGVLGLTFYLVKLGTNLGAQVIIAPEDETKEEDDDERKEERSNQIAATS